MSADRLADIKARRDQMDTRRQDMYSARVTIDWLIAEVERLRGMLREHLKTVVVLTQWNDALISRLAAADALAEAVEGLYARDIAHSPGNPTPKYVAVTPTTFKDMTDALAAYRRLSHAE